MNWIPVLSPLEAIQAVLQAAGAGTAGGITVGRLGCFHSLLDLRNLCCCCATQWFMT
jgi:hypothetical protein